MGINVLGHQTTIRKRINFHGVGVHSGNEVSVSLLPAEEDTGILFSILDPNSGNFTDITATLHEVGATDLCTVLGNPHGVHAATIEHLMAALRALNVDNVIVEIHGAEVPVMDGSSEIFVDAILDAGITSLGATRCYIRVNKPVRFEMGASWGEFVPYEGSRFEIEIDFECETIGRQRYASDLSADILQNSIVQSQDLRVHERCGASLGGWICLGFLVGEFGCNWR